MIPRSGAMTFTYDEGTNTLTFHGAAAPEAGEEVLVRYPIAGDCG